MHESNTKLSKSNTKLIHFLYKIIPFFHLVFRTYCSRDAILGKNLYFSNQCHKIFPGTFMKLNDDLSCQQLSLCSIG